jgi:uncharacterized membrane protein
MIQCTQKGRLYVSFIALVACAALFVWVTSEALPNIVASHFSASGAANGFMPREYYVLFMLAIIVVIPIALVVLPNQAISNPNARINLPNREYWLAPERRVETIEFLARQSVCFATVLLIFLCYAHWLVVRANALTRPVLSTQWFVGGLVVFLLASLIWVVLLLGRFRNVPH